MTINAPAAILLLLYELVGEEQGVPAEQLRGTIQNDILKEYIARGNFIYPPVPRDAPDHRHLRLLPRARPEVEHDLDLRLPHAREGLLGGAGGRRSRSPTRSPTCRPRSTPASRSTSSRPRLAFFFNGHNNVFQEVAKFRAVRRMWARDHARALRRARTRARR